MARMSARTWLASSSYSVDLADGWCAIASRGGTSVVFYDLTDPAALGVEPVRVRIIEAASSGTFRQAVAGHPIPSASGLDLAGLALLNGMEPESRVQAGQKLKVLR